MKVLIIGDSIVNNLPPPVAGATVKCCRGASIQDIAKFVGHRDIDVGGYDVIILHVGTNNTWQIPGDRRSLAADICSKMTILVGVLKVYNPTAKITISSILPRPRDATRRVKSDELFQY